MVNSIDTLEFAPGKLPGNQYAFKNCMFLNPMDYNFYLEKNHNREPIYVKAKGMILRLESLDAINRGEFGASAMQKEAMRISKIDMLRIENYRVSDMNPLATVESLVDVYYIEPSLPREPGKPLALEQSEIGQAIVAAY